jgi:hypothetical protein
MVKVMDGWDGKASNASANKPSVIEEGRENKITLDLDRALGKPLSRRRFLQLCGGLTAMAMLPSLSFGSGRAWATVPTSLRFDLTAASWQLIREKALQNFYSLNTGAVVDSQHTNAAYTLLYREPEAMSIQIPTVNDPTTARLCFGFTSYTSSTNTNKVQSIYYKDVLL